MSASLVITLIFASSVVHCYTSEQVSTETLADNQDFDNSLEEEEYSISALIEKANRNIGQRLDEPLIKFGDIAFENGFQNIIPCTSSDCRWAKSPNGNVDVPYVISSMYSIKFENECEQFLTALHERSLIEYGLQSISSSTCIRFKRHTNERDFLDIKPLSGCFSSVGRSGGAQVVSLNRRGCMYLKVVLHELLHALNLEHEHTRSDRDKHVRILFENIIPGQESNFKMIDSNNPGIAYDYNSIMHYGRYAFSRNGEPTIIPIHDKDVTIGRATQMSSLDVLRINKLYQCRGYN